MKMRHHKQAIYARMIPAMAWSSLAWATSYSDRRISWVGHNDPALISIVDDMMKVEGKIASAAVEIIEQRRADIKSEIEAAKVDPMITEFLGEPSVHNVMAVEAAKREFVCVKVKDGSVVDTFDTREDAEALVEKHVRGKKAKLEILETA
jgi:hypothetical protein